MLNKDKILKDIAIRESGNRDIDSPKDNLGGWEKARGKYQFRKSTWKSLGFGDEFDPSKQQEAASKLYDKNYNALTKKLGREPTEGEMDYAWHYGAGSVKGGEQARFKSSEYDSTSNTNKPSNIQAQAPTNQSNEYKVDEDTYYDRLLRNNLAKNEVNPNVIDMLLS